MSRLAAARQPQLSQAELARLQGSIQLFDQSKYKSSLKAAESVLATHPEHAESLAVKALCKAQFNSTVKQSLDIARQGVRLNMRSFLCWHALAICHRKNRQYAEALKAYSQAAKIDPKNFMIVREVALMSTMLRQYEPIIELRLTTLRLMPNLRNNWILLALAHHFAGSLNQAIRVLEEYEDLIEQHPPQSFEQSETWLYHATLLIQAERYQDAVTLLDLHAEDIIDLNARAELKGSSLLRLGHLAEAVPVYHWLIERNPHSIAYIESYLSAKGITPESSDQATTILPVIQELETAWPDSLAIRNVALKLLSGSEFEKRVETHFVRACQKGVPSLFNSLKQFYSNEAKRAVIGAVAEKHRLSWQEAALSSEEDNDDDDVTESPSAYLWSLYFLAQHYSYIGNAERAKAYINSAIAHTPTLPELHLTRARILKRTGDLHAAADVAEVARLLDGQDRYVNCKATKYALRINELDTAEQLAGKFTMKTSPTATSDLIDMQAFWFMNEQASSYLRTGQYSLALKRLQNILDTKDQFWAEQIDFHGWAARKFNLRAYLSAVQWWDDSRSYPAAVKAELQLVDLCLKLHDRPELIKAEERRVAELTKAENSKKEHEEANGTKLSAGQKKKLKAKQKAEAAKRAEAEAAKRAEAEANNEDMEPKQPDTDPHGIEALKALNPLAVAQSTIELLQAYAPQQVQTWLATFEWTIRTDNWLAAVRAAKQVQHIDSSHPGLHLATLRLLTGKPHVTGGKGIKTALSDAIASLAPVTLPESVHAEFVQRFSDSPAHTIAAAKGLLLLAPARKGSPSARRDEVVELVLSLPKQATTVCSTADRSQIQANVSSYTNPTLIALIDGLDLLRDPAVGASEASVQEYLQAVHAAWPAADAFKDAATLAQEAQDRKLALKQWQATDDAQNGVARPLA